MTMFDDLIPGNQPIPEPQEQQGSGMFDDLVPKPSALDQFAARYVTNPIMRGKNQSLDPVLDVTGLVTGTKTPEQFAEGIAQNQREAEQYRQDPRDAAAMQEFQKAKGFWESAGVLLRNPSIALQVGMESAPASLAVGAGGMAGAIGGQAAIPVPGVGAAAGLMAGTGLASAYVDFTNSFVQALTDSGQPITKETVLAAVNDPAIMARAKDYAIKHGMAVGAFDAISAGIAGRVAKPIERLAGTGVPGRVAGAAGEVGAQAALGAGGEASGQIAATGKVDNWKDVALEGVGEVVTGPLEIGQALASREAAAELTGQRPQSTVPPQSRSEPQGQRVDPRLFPQPAQPRAENNPPNPTSSAVPPSFPLDDALVQAGMAPTDIASMSKDQARVAVRDLVEQGQLPPDAMQAVENWPVSRGNVPQPGQAPRAQRISNVAPQVSPAPEGQEISPSSGPLEQGEAAPRVAEGQGPQEVGAKFSQPETNYAPIPREHITGLKSFLTGKKPITPENVAKAVGVDVPTANRLIAEGIKGGGIMQTRTGKLMRPPVRVKPLDVLQFIASVGGMRDERGELQARDIRRRMTPYGPLGRPNGRSEDEIRELLVENGYLTDAGRDNGGEASTTVEDVYRLIDQHLSGQKVYALEDQQQAAALEAEARNKAHENMAEAAGIPENWTPEQLTTEQPIEDAAKYSIDLVPEIYRVSRAMGITDFFDWQVDQIAQDVMDGADIEAAITNAIIQSNDVFEQSVLGMDEASFPDIAQPATSAIQEPVDARQDSAGTAETDRALPPEGEGDGGGQSTPQGNAQESEAAGATGAAQGEAGQEPVAPRQLSDAEFNAVWTDKEFRQLRKAYQGDGVGVHRESPAAADMVRGWLDEQEGKPLDPKKTRPFTPQPAWGANPVNFYLMARWYRKTGEYREIRESENAELVANWDKAEPTTEAGADNKPQSVIPGAEALPEDEARKAEAQRKARAEMEARQKQSKLRRGGQESVDTQSGGLFEEKSGDLFSDLVPKKEEPKAENQVTAESKNPLEPQESVEPKPEKPVAEEAKAEEAKPALELKAQAEKPDTKITDFGEKIHGARKDAIRDIVKSLEDDVDLASEPLSKTFPQPDYEKMAEAGVDRKALALVALFRNEIPTKPQKKYKLARWVEQVKTLREFSRKLLSGIHSAEEISAKLKEVSLLQHLGNMADLIKEIDPKHLPFAAKWSLHHSRVTFMNGKKIDPPKAFYILHDDMERWTDINEETLEAFIPKARAAIEAKIAKLAEKNGGKTEAPRRTPINIYQDRFTKDFFIGFKGLTGVIRLKTGFTSSKEIRAYMAEHADELQAQIDKMREAPDLRRASNMPRQGPKRREGDVSPQMFEEAFAFRGVQFGNYVEDDRRQSDLNEAFDALMDLADVLGIPSKALSLNGQLGLAFGARGHGGKNAAAAHYESDQIVINLTKHGGPGSLAHEWLHALDNYFHKRDVQSERPVRAYASEAISSKGGMREPVFKAWQAVKKALSTGPFAKRSEELDEARSKPYYSTMREKAARAFERYIVDRLAEKQTNNDYLANINPEGGAYPTEAEMQKDGIRQAYDELFRSIEVRTDEKTGQASLQATAPKTEKPPFYSALLRAVEGLKQEKAPKAQWLGMIRNAPGVKQEELDWLGLADWLGEQSGNITKQQITDFIRANQVEVQEVVKGKTGGFGKDELYIEDNGDGTFSLLAPDGEQVGGDYDSYEAAERDAQAEEGGTTKFSQYTLPGGENYRELLLTLPQPTADDADVMDLGNLIADFNREMREKYGPAWSRHTITSDERSELDDLERMHEVAMQSQRDKRKGKEYRSSHWDEPNILTHIRFNERTDADGKKVLFIEEVQSDWHQAGRKKGYKEANPKRRTFNPDTLTIDDLRPVKDGNGWAIEDGRGDEGLSGWFETRDAAIAAINEYYQQEPLSGAVPDAPFKTTWPELALKRMIRWAAEHGFDRIAWTPGDVQAERYDLSKTIKAIKWAYLPQFTDQKVVNIEMLNSPQITFRVDQKGHITAGIREGVAFEGRQIDDVIGKELAEKVMQTDTGSLSGLDLKVGGEGMRAFYDSILVSTANKLGKKFGVKVGASNLPGRDYDVVRRNAAEMYGEGSAAYNQAVANQTIRSWSFDIPPAMQKAAMEGQPLFAKPKKFDLANPFRFVISPKQQVEVTRNVHDLASRILGHDIASVKIVPDHEVWLQEFDDLTEAEFNPDTKVIFLALQGTRDPFTNFRHEAVHALRQAAVFTKPEWAVLSRMAEVRWIEEYQIEQRYAHYRERFDVSEEALRDILREEAVAEAFAHHLVNKLKATDPLVSRIFEKVKAFLEAVANYLKGRGYTTAAQIFEAIERGDMARRPQGSGASRGYHLTARQQARRMPKSNPNIQSAFVETDDSMMSVLMNRNLPLLARVGGAIANATLPLRRGAQDKMADWARQQDAITAQTGPIPASANVYRAETLYHGRTGERLEDLRVDHLKPLIEDMAARGVKQDELDRYLYARHAPERNAYIATIDPNMPDGGSGMTNAEAQQVMQDFQQAGKLADLRAVAARVDAMKLETANRLLSNGIIDQATFDNWYGPNARYKFYAPLQGFEQNPDADARVSPGKRYDTRTKVALKALGRRSKADSPLAYMIAQAQQSIVLSEKARVGRAVLRLARRYPNPRLWDVNQVVLKKVIDPATGLVTMRYDGSARTRADNVLAVREGGNLYWVTLHHEGLAAGVKGLEASNLNVVFRGLLAINRGLALMRTGLNPEFFITNFLRDLGTAGIHVGADQGKTILKGTLKDLRKAFTGSWQGERGNLNSQWAQYYREFAQAGGKVGLIQMNSIEQIKARTARDLQIAKGGTAASIRKAGISAKKAVEDLNAAVESAIRLSLYVNMRRAGYSADEAAFAAKEVTVNFNRKGEWGNFINAAYLFFNASIQGTARIALGLKRSKIIRRTAMGLLLSGFIMDMLNAMISGDSDDDGEDDYDQMPEYVKERNIVIPLSDGTRLTIPLPWVYNVFYYTGVNLARTTRGKVDPMTGAANIAGAIAQAANPLYAETWVQMVTPTILDPGLDLYTNQDWKGDPIRPEDKFGVPKPNSEKYWQSIPAPYREVARKLNELTGGDEVRPGWLDVSPEDMQYMVDFAMGGVGQLINNTTSVLFNAATGGEVLPERIPFSRKVVSQHSPFWGRTEYYQMRDAVQLTEAQMKNARENRDRAKMDEIRRDYGADLKAAALFDAADKQLKEIRKARQKATDPDMRKILDERANAIMAKTRKKYREMQEAMQP